MTSEPSRLAAKLSTLNDSLNDLEEKLGPLFEKSLPEYVIGLETIQQAKLQTVIPYLVYDLMFIYLKSRGIDPKSHPVYGELERVRQYFEKISNAENVAKRKPEIDKAAASRFIKHAITQATYGQDVDADEGPSTSQSTARVPVKVTSKMVARAEYEKELEEEESEGDEELEVFDEENDNMVADQKEKGKQKAEATPEVGAKRRRPAIDPFAGYGEEETAERNITSVKKNKTDSEDPTSALGHSTPVSGKPSKKSRSKRKSFQSN